MIIAVINQKGGVGKTITSAHLAACLAERGPVTLVDLDAQGSLSNYFEIENPALTMQDVLVGGHALDQVALEVRPAIRLAPSSLAMSEVEARLPHLPGGDLRLRKAFKEFKVRHNHDTLLVDCPAGWGALVRNAALAASHILIPINSESAALETAIATQSMIEELCEGYEKPVPHIGVLMTCFRETRLARGVAQVVRDRWKSAALDTMIRRAERLNELTAQRATVLDVSAAVAGTARGDYQALATEIETKWHPAAHPAAQPSRNRPPSRASSRPKKSSKKSSKT